MNAPLHLERPVLATARAAETPLIELRQAGVCFAGHEALQPLDLHVHAGERIVLLGANGSGKTTLLRLLHGQLHCSSGERRVPRDAQGREPQQAMLFQRPFLLRLSVWRNLLLALWLAGVPRAERAERAARALARVGLEEHAQRPARVLSGGQQQRLALARAWAVHPQILFLDEPTASLDPAAKREVEALVLEFAAEGMTVLMSTHNLGQAKRMATRVIYLEDGRLVVDRPVERFFNDPLPPEAALFLKGELPWH
ncbi:ABC transporter ATP-binding protein [Azohydromonas caseinilytica]|uniref:ATP-binding cassette domain-containing protein n=1 Tax=Azohydromonas caseinilytica TaxID=2728836 RepID=A0A848F6M8_9BURK|nr:ATP-binding cassette domain-containing protein [Azohydromonas caseinilytica]NML15032.1 ATP-binding cassette domain-containing protein [Azohydromonas caseinilytica]